MPVSVVVGGQYGSEGKGKVALGIARRDPATVACVRPGGPNSGHTVVDRAGTTHALRQLPSACVDPGFVAILPPGSYIAPEILLDEIARLGLGPDRVRVHPNARIVTQAHRRAEAELGAAIGSTMSGTGAAVISSVAATFLDAPDPPCVLARDVPGLAPYLDDTTRRMRSWLGAGRRILIEGTQGFGLSLLHGGHYPKCTARDTTAAAFVGEAGLSPLDVDDVTMVLRCHPIRVAGDSGPLPGETTWAEVAAEGGLAPDLHERTTVTRKVRRVARFDPLVVRRAIQVNQPNRIVLNHLDYVDPAVSSDGLAGKALAFVEAVERDIGQRIDWLGTGPGAFLQRSDAAGLAA